MCFLTCQKKNSTPNLCTTKWCNYYIVQNNKPYYENCTESVLWNKISFSNLIHDCKHALVVHLGLSLSFLYFKLCLSSCVWVCPLTSPMDYYYKGLWTGFLTLSPDSISCPLFYKPLILPLLLCNLLLFKFTLISDLSYEELLIFVPRGICSQLSYFNEEC